MRSDTKMPFGLIEMIKGDRFVINSNVYLWSNCNWPHCLISFIKIKMCFYVFPHANNIQTFFYNTMSAGRKKIHNLPKRCTSKVG